MKNLKRIRVYIALLMAISIVSVGYASWSIVVPTNMDFTNGIFNSFPMIKTDEYLKLNTPVTDFTEYCNYDPDPNNTDENGALDLSDVTGGFLMKKANAEGYLNVSQTAAVSLKLQPGPSYQGNTLFKDGKMKVEITVSFGADSAQSAAFFDSLSERVAVTGIPSGSSARSFNVEPTQNGTLLITGEVTIPKNIDLTNSVLEISLYLTADKAFPASLFPAEGGTAEAKNLLCSAIVKTVD